MRSARVFGAFAALAAFLVVTDPHAQDGGDGARRAAIVLRVGTRTVSAGELEDRLAQIPRFQLMTLGSTPDAIKRKFLTEVIAPEILLSLGAEERHLDREDPITRATDGALRNATLRNVRQQVGFASAIPMEDVKAFYEAHKDRFDVPERINVWRILCKTRDEAADVLAEAKKEGSLQEFSSLARDHSIDKATYLRGGNLGFLAPDGTSSEAGLKVDAALVKAAQGVKDGEMVAAPVAEGDAFAVIWRRGTVAAVKRTVDDAAGVVRDAIWKERKDAAEAKILAELRARDLKEIHPQLVDQIDLTPIANAFAAKRTPVRVPAPAPSASSQLR